MFKPTALLASTALALAVAAPLRAQDTTPAPVEADTVVATVNGENITIGHLVAARLALPEQFQALPNEKLFEALTEQLIQQTVLGQAMGEMTRRAQIQLENERRSIVAADHLLKVIGDAVTDEAIAAVYEADYANAEPTQEWNASHILVETEEEAAALVTELENGADFAELAKEKSTGPSGPGGGELGWFGPGMMVTPFEEAVSGMEVGAVSAPLQTQFGWHVVKLNDKRMKGAPALEEVRDEIVASLENDAVEQALETLLGAAEIERADVSGIDPDVLSDLSILD
ncbi:MAG: peptidylprolyl isomerase [Rhodobacterales bacterium]|nr:MAG: peptidylprolyl isomerase [Rhodobacterales bacterium]